jgi:hypothetical protein
MDDEPPQSRVSQARALFKSLLGLAADDDAHTR